MDFLIEKFKASIYDRTKDGSTLMHIAAINGHPETAVLLFNKGVPLLMPNKYGARGIHIAAKEGHVNVIKTLLAKGEQIDAKTSDNKTALHIAVEHGKSSAVEVRDYIGLKHCIVINGDYRCSLVTEQMSTSAAGTRRSPRCISRPGLTRPAATSAPRSCSSPGPTPTCRWGTAAAPCT